MKIVNFGQTYQIYPDDLRTYDQLPAGTYKINFSPMAGFSLEKIEDFVQVEQKLYGTHAERITKILRSYTHFERSLGVIFSGDKGMGKSLSVQLLAKEAVDMGLPVILVQKAYKGISSFIEKIAQESLIIFDEFEKVFPTGSLYRQQNNGEPTETQDDLLGLLDGTSQQKRFYALTVNDLNRVSEYMLSRTGRFHYHIRFDYPTADEIELYLEDKLDESYYGEIKHVIAFANRVKLNYDSLRAIAFELNSGLSFRSAISDLNILSTEANFYDVKVVFADGKSVDIKQQSLNLFSDSNRLDGYHDREYFSLTFDPSHIYTDGDYMIVPSEHIKTEATDQDGDETGSFNIASILIKKHVSPAVNYRMNKALV